jgi:hypothetical protein
MIKYAYDLEVFKNLFTATFVNVDDENEKHVFYTGLDKEDFSDIKEFLNQEMLLIGYNNHSFDDPLLRFLMSYEGDKFTAEAYNLSSTKLMDDNYRMDKQVMELRYPKKTLYLWKSIDLMRILAFDKLGISLKQTAINLKWYKIQDIPISPFSSVEQKELKSVLSYNLNDVLITKRLYEEITPIRELRIDLSNIYNVDLTSASDSRMANMILENIYSHELKMDIRTVRTLRTPREKVLLGECIAKFVKFESVELCELLDRVSTRYVYGFNKYTYSEKVFFANCSFVLGVGGLHTVDTAGKFETDDKYLIQDMDVASYYPNLIINNNFYPAHLGPSFIKVLKRITAERLQAKKDKDKVKADGLKITVNSIFGKMGSEHFWLHDPKAFLSTTISGQMGLLMLVEAMYMNGIEVISCNTDGVVCRIDRSKLDKYYEVAYAWEKATNLELEFTPYKKYIRRDVNSYITVKDDGDTKEKGAFLKEVDLKKAYHMPIVAKALHAYFVNSIPVHKTLEECKDIMEFCISQKTGPDFIMELHTTKKTDELQKTNRFYITTKGGALLKKGMYSNRRIGLYVGRQVNILNDYDKNALFDDYHVDLSFYEKEVMKIIDEIEPKQMTLFNLSFQDAGRKTKIATPEKEAPEIEKNSTSSELNKLGKNQLAKRIKEIVEGNEKIDGLDPRYVYIDTFEVRSMNAIVYCLAKGVRQSIAIDKQAYKKNKLEIGQIVYCNKFEKRQNGYAISEYRITEKLEEIGEKLI